MQVKKGAKATRPRGRGAKAVRPEGRRSDAVRPIVVEGVGSESRELEFTVPE